MTTRDKYLFIRILEACNADCFMCDFALSRDEYRFSVEEFDRMLPEAREMGVRYVRFTGGEPLMHRDVVELVETGTRHGMKMSIITNGQLLSRMIDRLAAAGLAQVIVSIDGGTAEEHDLYRRLPMAFDNGLAGLRRARELGLVTRVNTVVGPHNYTQLPRLQQTLTAAGVQQWELSALKLERSIVYPDPQDVIDTCEPIYLADPHSALVPLGKRFYGDTTQERERYFTESVTPRASRPLCHVVDDVIYLDAKGGKGFACSCISHAERVPGVGLRDGRNWNLGIPKFREHMDEFRERGPLVCNGCSTTAAGYSDDVARLGDVPAWHY